MHTVAASGQRSLAQGRAGHIAYRIGVVQAKGGDGVGRLGR